MTENLAQGDNTAPAVDISTHTEWTDGVAVVHVRGEVDMATAAWLNRELDAVVAEVPIAVVVDLTETTFMASSGLETLVRLRERAERSGFDLRVVAPSYVVRRPIELTGLDTELNLHDTVGDALVHVPHQRR